MQAELIAQLPDQFVVYAARHATPDRSRSEIPYHTPPGPELTPIGRSQAAALGVFLRDAGVVHILASPLVRALDTARIAAEISGAGVEIVPDLAERRLDEIDRSVNERMQRAVLLAARLSAEKGPLAFVSHGSPVLALLKMLGIPADAAERARIYDDRNLIPMAGAWRIARDRLQEPGREPAALSMDLVFTANHVGVAPLNTVTADIQPDSQILP